MKSDKKYVVIAVVAVCIIVVFALSYYFRRSSSAIPSNIVISSSNDIDNSNRSNAVLETKPRESELAIESNSPKGEVVKEVPKSGIIGETIETAERSIESIESSYSTETTEEEETTEFVADIGEVGYLTDDVDLKSLVCSVIMGYYTEDGWVTEELLDRIASDGVGYTGFVKAYPDYDYSGDTDCVKVDFEYADGSVVSAVFRYVVDSTANILSDIVFIEEV